MVDVFLFVYGCLSWFKVAEACCWKSLCWELFRHFALEQYCKLRGRYVRAGALFGYTDCEDQAKVFLTICRLHVDTGGSRRCDRRTWGAGIAVGSLLAIYVAGLLLHTTYQDYEYVSRLYLSYEVAECQCSGLGVT